MKHKELIIVSLALLLLTLVFFHKIFLGLIPLPGDITAGLYFPWLSYKWGYQVGVPVYNPKLSDAVSIIYPLKTLAADALRNGYLPLWNPFIFGGYPLLASTTASILFPTNLLYLIFSNTTAWSLQVMLQPLLASIFMYLLLKHLKLSNFASFFGAVVYGWSGSTMLWLEWNSMAQTSMFLPLLILFEDKYLSSKNTKWGIFFSICLAFQIIAGYLPIIPMTIVGLTVWFFVRSKDYKRDLRIVLYVVLGIALSSIFLLPVTELAALSQRKLETLDSSPFTPLKSFITILAPDFFGNHATANFWGGADGMDATMYSGTIAITLSLLAVTKSFKKTGVKAALFILIGALIISTANPVGQLLYKAGIWGGQSITMNRANFLINFSLAVLAAYGISKVKSQKLYKTAGAVLAFILTIAVILIIQKQSAQGETLAHISISLRNLILPLGIALSIFVLSLFIKFKVAVKAIKYAFLLVLIFELFRFGLKFNSFSKPELAYPHTPVSSYLENYPNERFIAESVVFPANMWVPLSLSAITGYDSIYPLQTAKFLAAADAGLTNTKPLTRWGILENFGSRLLDISGIRFFVATKRDDSGKVISTGKLNEKFSLPKLHEVFEDKGVVVLENSESFPRAYTTEEVVKKDDNDALGLLLDNNFPADSISITNDFEYKNSAVQIDSEINYKSTTPTKIEIDTKTSTDSFLVVLDSYYPGWHAYIDGVETKIHKTNYNFRGVFLPEGVHKVEFVYDPDSLKIGAVITLLSTIFIVVLLRRNTRGVA